MSKIIRFHKGGGPEVLQIDEMAFDAPAAGELLIRVAAIGLNRMEVTLRSGVIPGTVFPGVLGSECAGTVEAIGSGVSGFSVGDRVSTIPGFTTFPGFQTRTNGHVCAVYGEKAYVPADMAVTLPAELSYAEGASIWMKYTTAYAGLWEAARVQAGDFVVITAASSPVGLAAIQITNALGGIAIAATRTDDKAEALRRLGAEHVIVTNRQDLVKEVKAITGSRGAQIIFDPVAGASMRKLFEATARGGTILIYGILDLQPVVLPVLACLEKTLRLRFVTQFEVSLDPRKKAEMTRFVFDGLKRGVLKPIIDRQFRFADFVDAHRYLEGNQHVGKVVVTVL